MGPSLFSARGQGIPKRFDEDVVIRSGYNGHFLSGRMAHFGAIAQYFEIHIRYGRRVFSGIGDVDSSFKGQRRPRGFQYA